MFKKSKASTHYVGYGSVAQSVIEARKQQRHLVIKVLSVVFVIGITLSTFGFGGYKAIDFIQRSQNKVAKAAPLEEISTETYGGGTAKDKNGKPAWQRGTVTRVPRPEPVVEEDTEGESENAGIVGTACEEYPKFPDATCAGTPKGVVLTEKESLVITENDTVINAQAIKGSITVKANNVTIKNSSIRGNGTGAGITIVSGTAKIFDTEISNFENGIIGDNWKAYRVNIHTISGNGIKIGNYTTFEDSWIHNLRPLTGTVATGVRIDSGVANAIIRHNTIDLSAEANILSALYIAPDFGPSSKGPLQIEENLLGGGTAFTLQCLDGNAGRYVIQNISIATNHFVRSANVTPVKVTVPVAQSGNVWNDNGQAITF